MEIFLFALINVRYKDSNDHSTQHCRLGGETV